MANVLLLPALSASRVLLLAGATTLSLVLSDPQLEPQEILAKLVPARRPVHVIKVPQRPVHTVEIFNGAPPAANKPSIDPKPKGWWWGWPTGCMAALAKGAASLKKALATAIPLAKPYLPYVAGGAIVIVFIGGAYYYMYCYSPSSPNPASQPSENTSSSTPRASQGGPRGPDGPDEPPSDDEDSADEGPSTKQRDPRIPKKMMRDILKNSGPAIFKKMQQKLTVDKMGEIWHDPKNNFRIDAGSVVSSDPRFKTWNLQICKNPPARAVKKLLRTFGKRDTQGKLLWHRWNVENPPNYDAWVKSIMGLFP
ncbi:hypothetical protein FPANT_5953 [Fusarium pseudoanthophilum]|uniref:Uncharacterized protein n=1 Tax=Fusarium pseudoanthophilum TaxID=48495 RepID=A0A8H5P6J7_9HYPO|nr:hypothetical protein FPANT_5953 [Fusarium pseudoanthophilum]